MFNVVVGAVNHHLVQIRDVRLIGDVDDVLLWDLGFLAAGQRWWSAACPVPVPAAAAPGGRSQP